MHHGFIWVFRGVTHGISERETAGCGKAIQNSINPEAVNGRKTPFANTRVALNKPG
jgi:hypothetical protein